MQKSRVPINAYSSMYSLEMPNGVYRFCIDPKNRIPSISRTGFRMWKKNILRLKINVLRINVNYEACLIQMVIQARNSHSFFLTVLLVSTDNWDKEQQSKAQNSDSKYRQMALTGFDT